MDRNLIVKNFIYRVKKRRKIKYWRSLRDIRIFETGTIKTKATSNSIKSLADKNSTKLSIRVKRNENT